MLVCTEVDNVKEDADCDNLDIITDPGANASGFEAEPTVINEVQSAEVYM